MGSLLRKAIRYFRIHEGESMGGRFIVFGWGEAKTLIKIRVQIPICLWIFCRWDFESSGLLNGLYIFRVGYSFRVRNKKLFPLGTKLIIQHFYYGWFPWRKKCSYLSLELLEDSGLTKLGRHLAQVKPHEIWNEYYTGKHTVGFVA